MNNRKRRASNSGPGIEFDENGKLLPWKMPDCKDLIKDPDCRKQSTSGRKRPKIQIEPMIFKAEDFEDVPRKSRKLDKPARKELFKVPETKARISTFRRSSVANRKSVINRKSTIQKRNVVDNSPLINLEEAERLASKRNNVLKTPGYQFKPIQKPVFGFSRLPRNVSNIFKKPCSPIAPSVKSQTVKMSVNTPNNKVSDSDFIEMENACGVNLDRETTAKSLPLTNCGNSENSNINTGTTTIAQSKIVEEIKAVLARQQREFEAFQCQHQKHTQRIMDLLGKLTKPDEENNYEIKPNSTEESQTHLRPSEVFQSDYNLRKLTLSRNFEKATEFKSPRSKKAVDLYNTLRSDCTLLCTPNRNIGNSPVSNIRKSLSRKIESQCLLLQDTPRK